MLLLWVLPVVIAAAQGPQAPSAEVAQALSRARALLNAGNSREALPLLERAQEIAPSNADVRLLLGFLSYRERDLPRAQAHLEAVLEVAPAHAEALFGLGSIAYDRADYDGAVKRFGKCLAVNPEEYRAHYLLGEIASHREEFAPACEAYDRALAIERRLEKEAGAGAQALNLSIADALRGRGLAQYNLRRLDGAAKAYEEALGRKPDDAEVGYGLALVRMKSADYDAAIALLDRVLARDANHVGARYQRGLAREKRGDLAGAVEDLRAGYGRDPTHKGIMLNLGRALVRLSRTRTGEEAERLRTEGEALQGRYGAVSAVLDEVNETVRKTVREPRNAGLKLKLCTLYGQLGEIPRAAEQARQATALRPELARDPICLGLERLNEGKLDEARSLFETAARLRPEFPDSFLFLSLVEDRAGRPEESERLRGVFRRLEQEKARKGERTGKKGAGS